MKRIIILFFLCYTIPLIAQHTDPIQEAMANYDYETALSLIAQKKSTPPLLLQNISVCFYPSRSLGRRLVKAA